MSHSSPNNNTKHNKKAMSTKTVLTVLAIAVPCFFLGTLLSLYSGVTQCTDRHIVLDGAGSIGGGGCSNGGSGVRTSASTSPVERIMESDADIQKRVAVKVAEKVRTLTIELQAQQKVTVDKLVEERVQAQARSLELEDVIDHDNEAVIQQRVTEKVRTLTIEMKAQEKLTVDKLQAQQKMNVDTLVEERMKDITRSLDENCPPPGEKPNAPSNMFPTDKVGHFVTGMARTTKDAFTSKLDLGVPLDKSINGSSDVLVIYQNHKSLPKALLDAGTDTVPDLSMEDAMEHCDYLNVMLTHHTGGREQCIAIVPQYESYHLQKWMRINQAGALDKSKQLQKVSRGHQSNGRDQFNPPTLQDTHKNWDMLRVYLDSIHLVLEELRPMVEFIAKNNTIIVMVCNFGQSELLMNFVCSARARGFDISNILVFATDQATADLAESIGLAAYFDQRVRTVPYHTI
jgi:hypothetical protein